MGGFGNAPIKAEGQLVDYGDGAKPSEPKVKTTYVERRVPEHLEDKAHALIDKFLQDHGYNPKEI